MSMIGKNMVKKTLLTLFIGSSSLVSTHNAYPRDEMQGELKRYLLASGALSCEIGSFIFAEAASERFKRFIWHYNVSWALL